MANNIVQNISNKALIKNRFSLLDLVNWILGHSTGSPHIKSTISKFLNYSVSIIQSPM